MMCTVQNCGQPGVYRTINMPDDELADGTPIPQPIVFMCLKHTELALDNPAWEPEMLVSVPERREY